MKKPSRVKEIILMIFCIIFSIIFSGCNPEQKFHTGNITSLKKYNVIWDSPGMDHYASIPVGNGDIGLNVWVEENGDICFFIGKTDSWDENGRLLKVGKVRIKCDPAILTGNDGFRQELDLYSGTFRVSNHRRYENNIIDTEIQLWADANNPVIQIAHKSSIPVKLTAIIEPWRIIPDTLPELNTSDLLEDRSKPGNLHEPVIVEPDIILKGSDKYIGWYHHNNRSAGFDLTNKLQGLSEYFKTDPLLNRTFGALITGTGSIKLDEMTLRTSQSEEGNINIFVTTAHPAEPDEWLAEIEELAEDIESVPYTERRKSHENWWAGFWDRSWINATLSSKSGNEEGNEAFIVSRAYALQRFIDASAGRGRYPIKFNGSIFTVPAEGMPGNADYRRWGPGYWWQNTRLPYLSMCSAGDYDLMQSFFRMYADDIYDLSRFRTKKYFGFDGAYFPECMYFWGSVFTASYGWTPFEEREDKLQESGWHKWEWVAGPELVFMMLDYYDHTQDNEFLKNKIIPLANDVIRFFDNYYSTDENGKLLMHPSMACETWWDCTNPMPELAALHSITLRLIQLPESLTSDSDRQYWKSFNTKLPEIPLRETQSGKALAPAARFESKNNIENPELYAVFPFRLYGIGMPNPEWGINALKHRWDSGDYGWRQDDIFMTYLGLTEQAKKNLVNRAGNHDKNFRFPAFWGPNYDWTPDQDHGGVLMKTFQSMLLQSDPYSQKIYLLPAWPSDWNAEFKLHAPYKTVILGKIVEGKIKYLNVTPAARKKDLIILKSK